MDQIKSSLGRLWEISWETTTIYCTGSTQLLARELKG